MDTEVSWHQGVKLCLGGFDNEEQHDNEEQFTDTSVFTGQRLL